MTLFQSLVFAALQGFSTILPISPETHGLLLSHLSGWPLPEGSLLAAMHLGVALSIFIFYIHDWASMISSFLQVMIYRKRPMTLDERLPFFLLITSTPLLLALQLGASDHLSPTLSEPLVAAILFAAFAGLLSFAESMGKKTKTMFDWTTLEAILMSLAQLLALIPGAGRMLGVLSFSTLRNFNREAAIKFALLAGFPISAYGATSLLREYGMGGSDWTVLLNFGATLITAAVASFLALLGITRSFQITGVRGHVLYRVLGGVGVALWIWIKSRG